MVLSLPEEACRRAESEMAQEEVVGCAPIQGTKELTRDGKSTRRTI